MKSEELSIKESAAFENFKHEANFIFSDNVEYVPKKLSSKYYIYLMTHSDIPIWSQGIQIVSFY